MMPGAVPAYRPHEADGAPETVVPPPPNAAAAFSSDFAGMDRLGRDRLAVRIVDVLTHRGTETPLSMGLFGPPGSGKSLILRRVSDLVAGRGAEPADAGAARGATPGVVAAHVDLAAGGDPAATLAHALLDALAPDHAGLAEEALHFGSNPHEAAKLAVERSIALRRSLDGERKILDDFGARRARLVETVLFDTAGTRIDGYARANRTRIEGRLRAFGLPTTDPLRTFKDLVRETSDVPGAGSRLGLVLRALWGFKGQGTLIVLAVLLFAIGWAAGLGVEDQAKLSGWLAGLGDHFAVLTDWERAHLDLLQPIGQASWALGGLALAALVVRAARFAAPVLKGATLLKADLGERRRDIDGLIAQQTRRIDGLASEAEAAARNAEQAERRLGGRRGAGLSDHGIALATDLFGHARPPALAAQAFCTALSQAMTAPATVPAETPPARIVATIDGLDGLPDGTAATALETLHRLLARPGFVTLIAIDRPRMLDALGATDPALAAARLDRVVQLSYDLGAEAPDPGRLADLLLDPRTAEPQATAADIGRLPIDRVLPTFETDLLRGLAPFAGTTPRAIKRFVNAYRFARTDPRLVGASGAIFGCVAWGLAVDGTPAAADLGGFEADAAKGKVQLDKASELGRAFAVVHDVIGGDFTATEARRGLQIARSYCRTA